MSILKDHTVVSAKFNNKEHTIISILLEDPNDSDNVFPYIIDALDHEHEDYQALTVDCGWDLERIQKETLAVNQANYEVFRRAMRREFEEEIARYEEKEAQYLKKLKDKNISLDGLRLLEACIKANNDEDELFETKVYIFDNFEKLTKTQKTNIRKSQSLLELMGIVAKLIK